VIVRFELVGADRLVARLGKASMSLDSKTVDGLNEVADRIVDDAKGIVPVDTGSLQKSIRKQHHISEGHIHNIGVSAGGYVVNPKTGKSVNYASYLEYGTSRMAPRPFLSPALEMNRPFLRLILMGKVMESLQ